MEHAYYACGQSHVRMSIADRSRSIRVPSHQFLRRVIPLWWVSAQFKADYV